MSSDMMMVHSKMITRTDLPSCVASTSGNEDIGGNITGDWGNK